MRPVAVVVETGVRVGWHSDQREVLGWVRQHALPEQSGGEPLAPGARNGVGEQQLDPWESGSGEALDTLPAETVATEQRVGDVVGAVEALLNR